MKTIRILHVVTTMDFGGVETLLMSIYRNIDRAKVQFDFLCHNRVECKYRDEIIKLGGRLYAIPGPSHVGLLQYERILFNFFTEHTEYSLVHSHLNVRNCQVLHIAKKAGIRHRVSHSHIAAPKYSLKGRIYEIWSMLRHRRTHTNAFACSMDAGKYLFGKNAKYDVIPNAIQVNNFTFDATERKCVRDMLEVDERTCLIGHVGRFSPQKNHHFIISTFAAIRKKTTNAKLLLLGAGPLEHEIKELVRQRGIADSVIFEGQHSKMGRYYSAMDVFFFPSLFEGLGIVAIEAQCNGLPVIASTAVPSFAKVTEGMEFLPLNAPTEQWCETLLGKAKTGSGERWRAADAVAKSPYNLQKLVHKLQDFYVERVTGVSQSPAQVLNANASGKAYAS